MKFIEKVYQFDQEAAELKASEENYKRWGTTRDEHQSRMLKFIYAKMEEQEQKSKQSEASEED